MLVSFQDINFIIIGILILLGLLTSRFLVIEIATFSGDFEKDDKQTMTVMIPRGLASAILAINFGPLFIRQMPGCDGFFKDVAFVVIFGTAIITTIGVSVISRNEMKKITNEIAKEDSLNHDKIDEVISENSDK